MRIRPPAFRHSRLFVRLYLAAAVMFAWGTFSDDWHALVNDGVAITATSIVSGILVASLLVLASRWLSARRERSARSE